jgi:hypothetical protein
MKCGTALLMGGPLVMDFREQFAANQSITVTADDLSAGPGDERGDDLDG